MNGKTINISNMRIYTKYNFDKLELDKPTFIRGVCQNIRVSSNHYSEKYNVKFKIKKVGDGAMVTLIDGVQPLIKERLIREIEKDNFMTKSDMVIKLDRSQIETLIAHRNNLDYRVINNIDLYTDKCIFFEKSREITKFINQNNNVK